MLRHVSQSLLDLVDFVHGEAGRVWLIVLLEVLDLLELIIVPLHGLFPFLILLLGSVVCGRFGVGRWVGRMLVALLLVGQALQVLSCLEQRRLDIIRLSPTPNTIIS